MTPLLKKLLYSFLLLIAYSGYTQELETPQFPEPESQYYLLLGEDKINKPKALNGHIKQLERNYTVYSEDGNIEFYEIEILTIDKDKKLVTHTLNFNGDTSNEIQKPSPQTTDNIDGFKKITVIVNDERKEEYWYKNNKLVKYIITEVLIEAWEVVFTYDKKGRLVKTTTYDYDFIVEEDQSVWVSKGLLGVTLANYKNDLLVSKEEYRLWDDVINTSKWYYSYETNGNLNKFDFNSVNYSADYVDTETSFELQTFEGYKMIESNLTNLTGHFKYYSDNKLFSFSVVDNVIGDFIENYSITYSNQQIVIDGHFQSFSLNEHGKQKKEEKRELHLYTYDQFDNPITIKSYDYNNGKKVLSSDTKINISYH